MDSDIALATPRSADLGAIISYMKSILLYSLPRNVVISQWWLGRNFLALSLYPKLELGPP